MKILAQSKMVLIEIDVKIQVASEAPDDTGKKVLNMLHNMLRGQDFDVSDIKITGTL